MLRIEHVYWLVGAFLLGAAVINLRARRWSAGAFWSILATPFLFGDGVLAANARDVQWPAQAMGIAVIALGVLAARGRLRLAPDGATEIQARVESALRTVSLPTPNSSTISDSLLSLSPGLISPAIIFPLRASASC